VSYDADESPPSASLMAAAPGLLRLGATVAWRATEFGIQTTVRVGSRVVRGAAAGETPGELIGAATSEIRDYLRELLHIVDPEPSDAEPPPQAAREEEHLQAGSGAANGSATPETAEDLRRRGAELLRQSADVHRDEGTHPAYARILENLAPDEARVLRLLAIEGPQAAVDVRSAGPLGIGSEMLSSGLNMIGAEAGLRRPDRTESYLGNLHRLGLLWFSREQLEDQNRYHVLEAQPEVQVAMSDAGRTRTVRRSIHLTEFGQDFCKVCLPLDTVEIDALPRNKQ
jgi:hypothetical protein